MSSTPWLRSSLAALAWTAVLAGPAPPPDAGAPLDDESPAPHENRPVGLIVEDFTLRDLNNRGVSLSGHLPRGDVPRRGIVLSFNGVGCPVAELYAPRLQAIHERFQARGIFVLGINSSPRDSVRELRAWASGFGIGFPILKDHDQRVADALNVRRTTEVLLLDDSRRIVYRGAVDDQYHLGNRSVGIRKDRPEQHYLVDAIEALLRGEPIRPARTEPMGCVISRRSDPAREATVTYHEHVAAIVQERCQPCHREGEIAPFSLMSYQDVSGWSGMIREVVANGRMPPWHANPDFGRFSNDRSLSPREIDLILAWIDAGAPEGDPTAAPPPRRFATGWQMGEPDVVFEMSDRFTIPPEGTVPYRYSTVQTNFEEDRWVVASEVRAGNPDVVHHILVFAIDPRSPRRWRRETGGGTRGYFAIMVPGERPTVYPPGLAKRLPAGATLLFQVHYTPNGRESTDRSKVGFIFAREPVRDEVVTRSAFNQVGLIIPPGARRHTVRAYHHFRRPARLLSLLPHMHLRGESFRYELLLPGSARVSAPPDWSQLPPGTLQRFRYDASSRTLTWLGDMDDEVRDALLALYPDPADREALKQLAARAHGSTEVLLDVPLYDFNWQNTYRLARPLDIPRGAAILCTAQYNNSAFNPALTEDMVRKTVVWGNQTRDEMLIGYFDCVPGD